MSGSAREPQPGYSGEHFHPVCLLGGAGEPLSPGRSMPGLSDQVGGMPAGWVQALGPDSVHFDFDHQV